MSPVSGLSLKSDLKKIELVEQNTQIVQALHGTIDNPL